MKMWPFCKNLYEIFWSFFSPCPCDKTTKFTASINIHGNQRILKFNVNSGNYSYDLIPYGESLAEYFMMENADWEIFIDQGLDKPSGIDMYDDRLVVSDYATGDIIFYDISNRPPNEIGRIHTENQNNIPVVTGPATALI